MGKLWVRKAVQHACKNLGVLALGLAIVLGLSYSAELPKYRFQADAAETGRVIAGARLVSAIQSTELASPVSWFWPATTTWNFAWPDLAKQNCSMRSLSSTEKMTQTFCLWMPIVKQAPWSCTILMSRTARLRHGLSTASRLLLQTARRIVGLIGSTRSRRPGFSLFAARTGPQKKPWLPPHGNHPRRMEVREDAR